MPYVVGDDTLKYHFELQLELSRLNMPLDARNLPLGQQQLVSKNHKTGPGHDTSAREIPLPDGNIRSAKNRTSVRH